MTKIEENTEEVKPKRGRKKKVPESTIIEEQPIYKENANIEPEEIITKTKKGPNIIFFFIKLVIIFLIFDYVNPFIYQLIGRSIIYGSYSNEVIVEAVCFVIVIFVILMAGNKYIFTEKKHKFTESVKAGGAMFILGCLMLFLNFSKASGASIYDVISLMIYCILIGLFEEFMCRGWIQNELIERYSKTREQAILSIILSSLIFGGMHISNIWIGGQGVIETLSQVIQATGMGIYLGAVYYRTKNIWGNVFLHGFWDFAILLGEINVIKTCSEGNTSEEYVVSQLIVACIMLVIYTLLGLYVLRKSKLTEQYDYTEEEIRLSEVRKGRLLFIAAVLYLLANSAVTENENQICYEYENKDVVVTETTTPIYNEYYFHDNNVNLKLYLDEEDNKLKLKNLDSEYSVTINKDYISQFMVVKDKDTYHILVIGYNEYQTDTVLYYSSYLTSSMITNKEEYIKDFSDSFIEITSAPSIKELGYFYSLNDDTTYPYITTIRNQKLLLYNQELYTFTVLDYEEYIESN